MSQSGQQSAQMSQGTQDSQTQGAGSDMARDYDYGVSVVISTATKLAGQPAPDGLTVTWKLPVRV